MPCETKRAYGWCIALLLAAGAAAPAFAQTAGSIEGTVADVQGLAVPGTTVTLAGEALIAPQVAVTLVDGSYRFRALGRGAYDVTFELPGFRTLVREGVVVEGSRVIRIDAALELAAVAETVTVMGAAPVVDIRTTALVNDFGVAELQEVPSATDVWAVLGQTAGVRMRGFDVGGSHKSQQTGYESFGVRNQNRILADGVEAAGHGEPEPLRARFRRQPRSEGGLRVPDRQQPLRGERQLRANPLSRRQRQPAAPSTWTASCSSACRGRAR